MTDTNNNEKLNETTAACVADEGSGSNQAAEELFRLSRDYMEHRDNETALDKLRSASELDPENTRYRLSLAAALADEHEWDAAYEKSRTLLAEKNADYEFLLFHTIVARKSGNTGEALKTALSAIKLCPDVPNGYVQLGLSFYDADETEKACACYAEAYAKAPDSAHLASCLAHSLITLGKFDEARTLFDKMPSSGPLSIPAWYGRSFTGDNISDPEVIDSLEKTKEAVIGNAHLVIGVHFTLGDAYHRRKEYEKAFRNYTAGNVYRRKYHGEFDRTGLTNLISTHRESFTADFFSRYDYSFSSTSEKPIFIVGMPRSGTSLVEQILASHPLVHGCGELGLIGKSSSSVWKAEGDVLSLTAREVGRHAEHYLSVVEAGSEGREYVTDKMPTNFLHLWIAHLMFPHARIIHCERDPMDTCFSCFICNFVNGHEYSDSLDDIGFFYNRKTLLMDHWKSSLPTPIHDISYERLVEDTKQTIRDLLEFCRLPYDPACERFYETQRPVRTASVGQVRKRIYGSSIGKWRNYEAFLSPLKESLDRYT